VFVSQLVNTFSVSEKVKRSALESEFMKRGKVGLNGTNLAETGGGNCSGC
jgi:hypothetical protein